MPTCDYLARAAEYADRVIEGEIPACEYVRLACNRFVADLGRDDIYLSDDGNKWCKFLERLPHTKGRWAAKGERLVLSDWQVFAVVNIYGWHWVASGLRRFREVYIEVGRKNGKSLLVAGIGVGHLCIDDEYGAEVYCGATTELQAWEVFRPAKLICERSPALLSHYGVEVNAKSINVMSVGSRFQPVIGKPGDGSSPSCAIVDEFHEHADSDQIDTFRTGMGAREQPMLIVITTAGADMGGPCYAMRSDVIDILKGSVSDDQIFGIIYTIDEGDPWDTEEALVKANPNLDISISRDFLKGQLAQARRKPTAQVAYKTKHLNCWVGAKAAWMNMLAYQACRKRDLELEAMKGRRCFIGVDLASKVDIASMALYFPADGASKASVFVRHYLPEETILNGPTRYQAWHASGDLIATPGNVIDFTYIEDDLDDFKSQFEIVEVPYDPFQATQFATRMLERGFPVVELGATVRNFSEPMKELEAMILDRKIEFTYDPVLLWMFGNVVARLDKKDNIFPDKERPENKIDGVVATIMAVARGMAHEDTTSVYETRGLVIL